MDTSPKKAHPRRPTERKGKEGMQRPEDPLLETTWSSSHNKCHHFNKSFCYSKPSRRSKWTRVGRGRGAAVYWTDSRRRNKLSISGTNWSSHLKNPLCRCNPIGNPWLFSRCHIPTLLCRNDQKEKANRQPWFFWRRLFWAIHQKGRKEFL